MKTVYRVLIILFVAALLGGMMYAAASAGGSESASRERRFEDPPEGRIRPKAENGIAPPFGVFKSLVLMSLVGVPFFFWRRKR